MENMYTQLTLDLRDQDEEYTWNNHNILMVSEIQKAGFLYTAYPAFVVNEETDEIVRNQSHIGGSPKLAYTYLLGEVSEDDTRPIKPEVKKQAIDQMNKLGIRWVHQVYFGEIFIPKDQIRGRRHHMFARATIKQTGWQIRQEIARSVMERLSHIDF